MVVFVMNRGFGLSQILLTLSMKPTSMLPKQWETNEDEIKAFIGFTIMMGLSRRSGLYDNWSTIPLFHCFPIASRIARHRFIELKRYLHFTDNNNVIPRGKDGYDKLAKIRPVLTAVQQTCVHNYSSHNRIISKQSQPGFSSGLG